MHLDRKGFDLLAECEGFKLTAYKCPAGIWTIGVGNTFYENGSKVAKGDKITHERAYELFNLIRPQFEKPINDKVKVDLSQNQFNALFIFAWNVGVRAFSNSTLLKFVNAGCTDKQIEQAFMMWKGKKDLLLSRRQKEFKMWCSK